MYKIQEAEMLANNIYRMVVEAPRVAQHCLPGQFVIVKADEEGERIPLASCDYDREAGTITIVFMPIGESTKKMKDLKAGDAFMDFVGPLGQPSEFCSEDIEELKKKRIVFVAGGVGTAPVYPQLKWLHEHGVAADVIVGSKTKDLLILESLLDHSVSIKIIIQTGDNDSAKVISFSLCDQCTADLFQTIHAVISKFMYMCFDIINTDLIYQLKRLT